MPLTIDDNLQGRSRQETWLFRLYYGDDDQKQFPWSPTAFYNYMVIGADDGYMSIWNINYNSNTSLPFQSGGNPYTYGYYRQPVGSFHPDRHIEITFDSTYSAYDGKYRVLTCNNGLMHLRSVDGSNPPSGTSFMPSAILYKDVDPYLSFATNSFTDENGIYYYPLVRKVGSIKDSIDLMKSKSRTSNISLEIINESLELDDNNSIISDANYRAIRWADLMYSNDHEQHIGNQIMNKKLEIFSVSNHKNNKNLSASGWSTGTKTYHSLRSEMHQIYTGRINKIDVSGGIIKIGATSLKPETDVLIPSQRDQRTKIKGTIAYGDFSPTSPLDLYNGKKLFPVNYTGSSANFKENFYLLPVDLKDGYAQNSGTNMIQPHYYDSTNERFYPLLDQNDNPSIAGRNDGFYNFAIVDQYFRKKIKIKMYMGDQAGVNGAVSGWIIGNNTSPPATDSHYNNLFDNQNVPDDASSYAQAYHQWNVVGGWGSFVSYSGLVGSGYGAMGSIKIVIGWEHKGVGDITWRCTLSHLDNYMTAHPNNYSWMPDFGGQHGLNYVGNKIAIVDEGNGANTGRVPVVTFLTSAQNTNVLTPTTYQQTQSVANFEAMGNPELCLLQVAYTINNLFPAGQYNQYLTGRIYDLTAELTTQIDQSSDQDVEQEIKGIDQVFMGCNGTKQSWNATPTDCDKAHQMHRDLLYRYAGVTETPSGWADLESARSSTWTGRYFLNEEKELEKVLDQLQEEGAFIYRYDAQGNLSYVFVKETYNAGDVNATLTSNDLTKITCSATKASDLITRVIFNYDPHPAKPSERLKSYSAQDITSLVKYNVQNREKEKVLNMAMSVNNATGLANHFLNLFSEPKYTIKCEVVNPRYFGLQCGDIVQFESDSHNVVHGTQSALDNTIFGGFKFGQAQTFHDHIDTCFFMIINISRSIEKFTIIARQVS